MSITSDVHFYLQQLTQQQGKTTPQLCPLELQHTDSPCLLPIQQPNSAAQWQAFQHNQSYSLRAVEQALDLTIRPEVHAFYNYQYSDHFQLMYRSFELSLLQLWNDDDFNTLQQNLIAHLVTQRRLKLKPTLFIGTTQYPDKIISVDNVTGEIIIEKLGKTERQIIADNLILFLSDITATQKI